VLLNENNREQQWWQKKMYTKAIHALPTFLKKKGLHRE
jgi:hypothetical protein